jgi:hypothetical protein
MYLEKEAKMSKKYVNLEISIDGESVNVYIETGGEPVHIVYWTEDEWLEDAKTVVPAINNAIYLFFVDPDELIQRILNLNTTDPRQFLITPNELKKFIDDWGQTHEEICSCLGYDEDSADDLLRDDYFWYEEKQIWCNKDASGFEGKDELISKYLRNL